MKKLFGDSSEQLKERLRRIVQKPNFFLAAEIALLASVALIAALLLVGALQEPGMSQQPELGTGGQPHQPGTEGLEKLEITALPYRCVYVSGQQPDTAGIEVTLTYADGTSKKVTQGFSCSPQVLEDYGRQMITVTLDGISDSFEVVVKESLEQGSCGTDLQWEITADAELIITGTGKMRNFYGNGMPWRDYKIQKVYLPEGLCNIGNYAFSDRTTLKEIRIPETVCDIGTGAFAGCTGLTTLRLSEGVHTIGLFAFAGCTGLADLRLPESVSSIGARAFEGCTKLKSFRIPVKVEKLAEDTFSNCTSLREVFLPDGLTDIGSEAFQQCTKLNHITIPDSVKSIGAYAFRESGLQQITIPDGVTQINTGVFSGCSELRTVNLPKTVSSISDYAFEKCFSLTSFRIPAMVQTITGRAFCWSGVRSYTVDPENVYLMTDEHGVVYTKDMLKLVLYPCDRDGGYAVSQGCKEIEALAFYACGPLSSITFPDTLKSIGFGAFWLCSGLTQVVVPASVEKLGNETFYTCVNLQVLCVMNPQCEIPFDILGSPKKTVFYGYEGSTLDQYAFELDCRFVILEK